MGPGKFCFKGGGGKTKKGGPFKKGGGAGTFLPNIFLFSCDIFEFYVSDNPVFLKTFSLQRATFMTFTHNLKICASSRQDIIIFQKYPSVLHLKCCDSVSLGMYMCCLSVINALT